MSWHIGQSWPSCRTSSTPLSTRYAVRGRATPLIFTDSILPTGPGRTPLDTGPHEQPSTIWPHPHALYQMPPEMYGFSIPIRTGLRPPQDEPETGATSQVPLGAQRAAHGRMVTGQVPMRYAVSDASSDQANA